VRLALNGFPAPAAGGADRALRGPADHETTGSKLGDLRNVALVLVMRDLLTRRSEVAALDVADIADDRDGSGTAMIRRSKTDQTGEGAELYLSPRITDHLRRCAE
jgi:hypothetical protein